MMKQGLFTFAITLACVAAGHADASGQTNTYHFGDSGKAKPAKLPKLVPGRLHLLDGSTRNGPVGFVDYNQVVTVENDVVTEYTPLQVSSFVMKQDSFIVLKDFKIALGTDEQEFRVAFVQVGAAGPGFVLYHFKGTMRHDDVPQYQNVAIQQGTAVGWSGGVRTSTATEYSWSKVWFVKLDSDPRWLSLPRSGGQLKDIVEPLIADDKKLTRSVEWSFLDADEVQGILLKYAASKSAALK